MSPFQGTKEVAFCGLPARKGALPPPPPPPPTAPRDSRRLAPGGGAPWAGLPGIGSTWSDVTRGGARASGTPLASGPRPLTPGRKHRPQEGALRPPGRLPPHQVAGGAGALSVGGELGAETGDPPERAQPSPGLPAYKRRLVLSWDACVFSNIPRATLRGQLHPHIATQSLQGWGQRGPCQPKGSALRTLPLPQPPFATGSTPFISPYPTPSDLDTPTASHAALETLMQSHSHNYPLPQTICSSPTPSSQSQTSSFSRVTASCVTLAHNETH